jgi:hypothetical protein
MKEQTAVPIRPPLEKKLALNKETIRILTDREMVGVEAATCPGVHPRSTCRDQYSVPGQLTC